MTQGFFVALHLPFEGVVLLDFPTKKEAVERYEKGAKDDDHLGVALLHIEIVKEHKDWR